jgi:hypothetical protein
MILCSLSQTISSAATNPGVTSRRTICAACCEMRQEIGRPGR